MFHAIVPVVPGSVIKVRREEKLGFLERLYVPAIAKGLRVTSRHFFRNLRGFVTGKRRTDFVVQYPEERVDYADAFQGQLSHHTTPCSRSNTTSHCLYPSSPHSTSVVCSPSKGARRACGRGVSDMMNGRPV